MLLENYSSAKVTQITTEIHLFADWPLFYPGERVDSDPPPLGFSITCLTPKFLQRQDVTILKMKYRKLTCLEIFLGSFRL